jgi:hypothetical protein
MQSPGARCCGPLRAEHCPGPPGCPSSCRRSTGLGTRPQPTSATALSTSFEGGSGGLDCPSHLDDKSRPQAAQRRLQGRCNLFDLIQMSNWELLVRTRPSHFLDGALVESRTDSLPERLATTLHECLTSVCHRRSDRRAATFRLRTVRFSRRAAHCVSQTGRPP